MPQRLPELDRRIARASNVRAVFEALQSFAGKTLRVHSICLDIESFAHDGTGLLNDESVPREMQRELRALTLEHGINPIVTCAVTCQFPFTFQEAYAKASGKSRLVFQQLADDYRMHDGFLAPMGQSLVAFWSEKRLGLDRETRLALHQSGTAVVDRLKELMPRKDRSIRLSPRELEALEHLARGLRAPEIAKRMGVSVPTVHNTLSRVRKKLKAKTLPQATMIAVCRDLI